MRRKALLGALALLVVVAAFCAWARTSEWWRVDGCLDAGGRWDREAGICEGAG